ncbi:TPA: hypothetical protein HA242_02815 [Candidatus Woesearchaeota archaeon]|nr:hypothetical protein [Candidatus Woesearchaeota archaeon]HIG93324.1 hypothetical protein [Candidatus Woesearchaeota archaeon]HIH12630.1 hypothetical protein [Candidatus Woesearchaeota archaeon]
MIKKAHRNRWSILWCSLFILISALFLGIGFRFQSDFYTVFHWYLWMGTSFIFLMVGIMTWIWQVKRLGKKGKSSFTK